MRMIQRNGEKKEMKGDVVSPRMKKESREEGLKREERMAIVAKNMDQYMDNRIRVSN